MTSPGGRNPIASGRCDRPIETTTGMLAGLGIEIARRIRSEASTDPPGQSTRTTSALIRSRSSPRSISFGDRVAAGGARAGLAVDDLAGDR